MVKHRNNIVLVKRDTLKRVTLPNGRTFLAKYRRVNRHYLPGGTTIARTYRGRPVRGPRVRQGPPRRRRVRFKPAAAVRWRGMTSRGIGDVVKSVAGNPYVQEICRKLTTKGISSIPGLYKTAKKRIKNKHLRKIVESDIATDLVDRGTESINRRAVRLM